MAWRIARTERSKALLVRGRDRLWVDAEIAERMRDVGNAGKLGMWQMLQVEKILLGYKVPATAARLVSGRAWAYLSRYQRALQRAMAAVGAELVLGPRGGRWTGYYVLPVRQTAEE